MCWKTSSPAHLKQNDQEGDQEAIKDDSQFWAIPEDGVVHHVAPQLQSGGLIHCKQRVHWREGVDDSYILP